MSILDIEIVSSLNLHKDVKKTLKQKDVKSSVKSSKMMNLVNLNLDHQLLKSVNRKSHHKDVQIGVKRTLITLYVLLIIVKILHIDQVVLTIVNINQRMYFVNLLLMIVKVILKRQDVLNGVKRRKIKMNQYVDLLLMIVKLIQRKKDVLISVMMRKTKMMINVNLYLLRLV